MANSQAQNVKLNQDDNAIGAHLKGVQFSFGTLTNHLVDPNTGQMWYGAGNPATNWSLSDNPQAEVATALKVHIRQGADLTPTGQGPNGEQDYTAPAGLQAGSTTRAAINFDYGATTDDGPANALLNSKTLGDETFKMQFTVSGGVITSPTTAIFDLDPASHMWVDEANPSFAFGGDDFSQPGASPDLMAHVAENSINVGFGAMQGALGHSLSDLTQAGTHYDIKLAAFGGNGPNMDTFSHIGVTLT